MADNSRIFHIRDGVLKEHGQTVLKMLPEDIGEFKVFDTTITEATIDNIAQNLQQTDQEVKDETMVAEIMGNTEIVDGIMQQGHKAYGILQYFVDKAFKDNESILKEFGVGELHKVKGNQLAMISLLETMAMAAQRHSDKLLSSGMSQRKLNEIIDLPAQLKEANTQQETSKKERPQSTQQRVEALNTLYLQLKQISDAAPHVFEDNEAKIKAYKLPV